MSIQWNGAANLSLSNFIATEKMKIFKYSFQENQNQEGQCQGIK